jgi:prolyl oligopeptidase
MPTPGCEGRTLLDANALSTDGTIALSATAISEDGTLLAYATSTAGSDWMTWRVRDVASSRDLNDAIEWCKFGGAAWRPDLSGFYYVGFRRPAPGEELQQETRFPRILFHRLGTSQDDDQIIFASAGEPNWLFEPRVTPDGRFLLVTIRRGSAPQAQVQVLDLVGHGGRFRPLVGDFVSIAEVIGNVGSTFYLVTDHDADRLRVVAVDLNRPTRSAWREVIPQTEDLLVSAAHIGGRLICHYLHHATARLAVHDLDGTFVRELPVPTMSALSGLSGRPDSPLLHFGVTSFTDPGSIWAHDLSLDSTDLLWRARSHFQGNEYVSEQVFVRSADGTAVPLFLTRHRSTEPTGDVPVLLYGYGGFNIPMTPSFSPTWATWLERGGMLAVACLRGGGEYGRAWHEAGRLTHKQNVFDDFCACADWLHQSGWSRPDRIGINGGSNGGLLVGACIIQRPELFGAAVPEVGVFDMLRFHKFTVGWAWTSDYGDPEDAEQAARLRAYSPLHNVRKAACYPPTMIMTGDHDDRVVPGHSFKFAAMLKAAQGCDNPILLRVERSAGHGAGKPTSKSIAERTDLLTFLDRHLGSKTMSES